MKIWEVSYTVKRLSRGEYEYDHQRMKLETQLGAIGAVTKANEKFMELMNADNSILKINIDSLTFIKDTEDEERQKNAQREERFRLAESERKAIKAKMLSTIALILAIISLSSAVLKLFA